MAFNYFHIIGSLVPLMTAANAPSPFVASASDNYSTYYPYKVFTHDITGWFSTTNTGWLKIYVGSTALMLDAYTITTPAGTSNAAPNTWIVYGSNNDTDWTEIDSRSGESAWGTSEMRKYVCASPGEHKYFKIVISSGNGNTRVGIGEWGLYPDADLIDNTSTTYATLDATSATAPSPQVITAKYTNSSYPPYKLFSQDTTVGVLYTSTTQTPQTIMVDHGSGNEKIINKYSWVQPNGFTNKQNNCPKNFIFQGSNDTNCAAGDTQNANGWIDLDTRTDCIAEMFGVDVTTFKYFTFTNTTAYRFHRFYITDSIGGFASYGIGASEVQLVESTTVVPTIKDIDESSESTDSISNIYTQVDNVTENFTSTENNNAFITTFITLQNTTLSEDGVDVFISSENIDKSESSGSSDIVEVFQNNAFYDIDENTSSDDLCEVTIYVYTTVSESSESQDDAICSFLFTVDSNESSESIDSTTLIKYLPIDITQQLSFIDSNLGEALVLLADELIFTENLSNVLNILMNDVMFLIDTHLIKWNGTQLLVDSVSLIENIKLQFIHSINESMALTDSSSAVLGLFISEFIGISEVIIANWRSSHIVQDNIVLLESTPIISFIHTINESLNLVTSSMFNIMQYESVIDTLTAIDESNKDLVIAVLEYLGFNDLAVTVSSVYESILENIVAADIAVFGLIEAVSDLFSLVDTNSIVNLLVNSITESVALSETLSGQLSLLAGVEDSFTLVDVVSSRGVLYNTVYDTLRTGLSIELDGETWECYVLNTPKFTPSIYSGFAFNSYAVFDNRAYGCKSDGIYELIGDTDNGAKINTGLRLSTTSFNVPNNKRFRKAYVGISGTKPVFITETETGATKVYNIDAQGEVDISRALKSKKWTLSVANFDTLDFIKLIPVVLTK